MNFKTLAAAAAVSIAGMSANAAIVSVTDAGGDSAAFGPALTLNLGAVDTAVFDTTSTRFNFSGIGSSSESFDITTNGFAVLGTGNVVFDTDYTKAELTIDGHVFDLLTASGVVKIAVTDPITVTTNFVSTVGGSTFDFALKVTPVPVPAGILLMGTALAGFGVMRRRKDKKAA